MPGKRRSLCQKKSAIKMPLKITSTPHNDGGDIGEMGVSNRSCDQDSYDGFGQQIKRRRKMKPLNNNIMTDALTSTPKHANRLLVSGRSENQIDDLSPKSPPLTTTCRTYSDQNFLTPSRRSCIDPIHFDEYDNYECPENIQEFPNQNLKSPNTKQTTPTCGISDDTRSVIVNDNEMTEDLLLGLCPEDLSFSFHNNSSISHETFVKRKGITESSTGCSKQVMKTGITVSPCIKKEVSSQHYIKEASTEVVLNKDVKQLSVSSSFYPSGTFYGLPMKVLECLKEYHGISKLYEWQESCLSLPSVCNGQNLIYSLPTSGGKTLVAEILIFRQLLIKGKDVLLVLPFVSIVQEKVRELLPFAEALGFSVDEYAGSRGRLPPRKRLKKHVVYIATIEKANALVNSMIELERLNSIGLVVVDELHMLGESGRGATLESCLSKILFAKASIQIIGMSATLSNLSDLAKFLNADLYCNEFRPVKLREYIKLGRCVYSIEDHNADIDLQPQRDICDTSNTDIGDIDQLSSLVMEVVPSFSCLVFCHTRKNCENVAVLLTKTLPRTILDDKKEKRKILLQQIDIEAAGLCPVLAQTIPWGIAYHHSGLTADERKLIEEAYLEGTLCVITCTSTLAAGVNLPAKRVILRSPYIGREFITRSQYKQMVGRAGRSGLCENGESIVIIQPKDKMKMVDLLKGPYDQCTSCLLSNDQQPLVSLLLSLVTLKLISSTEDLIPFLQCTLIFQQHDHTSLLSLCHDALSMLSSSKYIMMTSLECNEQSDTSTIKHLEVTKMGKAVHKGCLSISIAHIVYQELCFAQECLVLTSDLHLLSLVVSHDIVRSIQPNWTIYFETITRLSPIELKVADILRIKMGYLSKKATGVAKKLSESESLSYTRFYITLILHYLLKNSNTNGVWLVADMFQCSRGFLQSLLQQTSSFAACLVHFTEELSELWPLKLLLPTIVQRLSYAVSTDLVPLMEIPGIKQGRARQFFSIGIKSPQDLVTCSSEELCDKIDHLFSKQAKKLIQAAKTVLAEKAEILQEEAQALMTLAPPLT